MTGRVPPQLARLVDVRDDGALAYSRSVTDPGGALLGASLAVPLLLGAGWALSVALGPSGTDLAALAAIMLVMGGGTWAALAYLGRMHRIVRSVVTRSGIAGPRGLTFDPDDRLELLGDVGARTASLVLVRPSGAREELKDWKVLRHARTDGWDAPSVRWFAEAVAERAGLPLRDALPALEEWEAADEKREVPWDPTFAASYQAPPVPMEPTWGHDGIGVVVPRSVSLAGEPNGGVTIDISPTHLRTTDVQLPIGEVHRIVPWFGMGRDGSDHTEMAEIRAVLDHRTIVLARRRVDRVPAGVVRGIVEALEDARQAAREREDGDRTDVPATMARLAQRARRPEGL